MDVSYRHLFCMTVANLAWPAAFPLAHRYDRRRTPPVRRSSLCVIDGAINGQILRSFVELKELLRKAAARAVHALRAVIAAAVVKIHREPRQHRLPFT